MSISNVFLLICLFSNFMVGALNDGLDLVRVEFWNPTEGVGDWVPIKGDGLSNVEISGPSKTKVWMLNDISQRHF